MKKIFYFIIISLVYSSPSYGQTISFKGCTGDFGNFTYTFSKTGTTTFSGTVRNTYELTPVDFNEGCTAGVCEARVIYTGTQWELQLDNDSSPCGGGGLPADYGCVEYHNTTDSFPNPPDLTLGTWVGDATFCSDAMQDFSGTGTQNFIGAPSTAPEIALSANSNNIADGSNLAAATTTNGTDFANVCVEGGTATITYTITNSGDADLTLDGTAPNYVTLSGGNAGDFSVTTQPSSGTVPHTTSNTTTFEITFNPTATGERSTTVSIANNDSNENPFDFVIKGTGVQPTVTVAATTASIAENSGSSLVYRFTRTTCTVETLAVNFSISGTTADTDYTVVTGGTGLVTYNAGTNTGTITFPANSQTVDLTVTPVGDTDIEADETVVVTIDTP
ncbi:MAG: choice-of-anchor D domain-containing protein [Chitinophagales bacterium]